MSSWLPEQEPLRQLISFLNDSLSGRDFNVQRKAELVRKIRCVWYNKSQ